MQFYKLPQTVLATYSKITVYELLTDKLLVCSTLCVNVKTEIDPKLNNLWFLLEFSFIIVKNVSSLMLCLIKL